MDDNRVLDAGSTLSIELNGPLAGFEYDRIVFTGGDLYLGDPTLAVSLGYAPTVGQSFTILSGFTQPPGFFDGLVDGAQFVRSYSSTDYTFEISYSTNAVMLTVIPEPGTFGVVLSVLAAAIIRRRRIG